MYNKFKEYMFDTSIKKTFHIYQHGLIILSPVTKIEHYYEDAGIKVTFDGGNFHVWKENRINKVPRPANLLRHCENCYSLHNEYADHIGYVYN
jgi:hypothetical protein